MRPFAATLAFAICVSSPVCVAQAQTARDLLLSAAYSAPDKATAQARVGQAIASSEAAIRRNPRDQDARLQRALAVSYRGKLTRSRSDLAAARRDFEAAVAAAPRNAEAHMALAGWHLGAVIELGPMMARTVLGARTAKGNEALDRALSLAGGSAAIPALASLHRIQLDPADVAGAQRLAEASVRAKAATPFDRVMQRQAATLLAALRRGNGKAAAATAKRLMPFGRFDD